MTEDEDYFLQISPQEKQGFLKVYTDCGKCKTPILSQLKDSKDCSSPYTVHNF